uniref:ATP synthase subunit 4, mitochondrial n=1 Tax=Mycena chlorophos TaxID=658473 RepID=A0ABQ0LZU6_MYCCL|nr:predicted protein [Mycena chlorophos]
MASKLAVSSLRAAVRPRAVAAVPMHVRAMASSSNQTPPEQRASEIINKLPESPNLITKAGTAILGTGVVAAAISSELYVVNEETILLAGSLIFLTLVARAIRQPYSDWADAQVARIKGVLDSARADHTQAVKDRIDNVAQMKDVVGLTKSLFALSKETAQLESEAFVQKQQTALAAEVKSVLDSWVRYEQQVKENEQAQLAKAVIDKVNAAIQDEKTQKEILMGAVAEIELLILPSEAHVHDVLLTLDDDGELVFNSLPLCTQRPESNLSMLGYGRCSRLSLLVAAHILSCFVLRAAGSANVSVSNTAPEIEYTPFLCNAPSSASNSGCSGGWNATNIGGIPTVSTFGPASGGEDIVPQMFMAFRASAFYMSTSVDSNATANFTVASNTSLQTHVVNSADGLVSIVGLDETQLTSLVITFIPQSNASQLDIGSILLTVSDPDATSSFLPTETLPPSMSLPTYVSTSATSTTTSTVQALPHRAEIAEALSLVLGVGIGLCIIAGCIFFWWRRRKKLRQQRQVWF